jgi:lipopolysaccharide export system permease protein
MKILEKHLFKNFLFIFLFCATFLYVIFIVGDIFGFLDEILRAGITAKSLFLFYYYMMPYIMTQLFPICCVLSSVFLLGNLNKTNEIIAMKANGISLLNILKPLMICSLVIGVIVFFMNELVVPKYMQRANRVRYEKLDAGKRSNTSSIKNIALYGQGQKMIFVKKFDLSTNTIHDIIIHSQDKDQKLVYKLTANKLMWKNNKWQGYDVFIYNLDKEGNFKGMPEIYDKKIIDLKETPLDFVNNQWQPQYMSFRQLHKYLRVFLGASQSAQKRLTVELYYKTAVPFACLVMLLVGAPFAMVTARGAAMVGMSKGILIALTYIPLTAICLALGKAGSIPPFLSAWLSNIILGGFGLYKICRD